MIQLRKSEIPKIYKFFFVYVLKRISHQTRKLFKLLEIKTLKLNSSKVKTNPIIKIKIYYFKNKCRYKKEDVIAISFQANEYKHKLDNS